MSNPYAKAAEKLRTVDKRTGEEFNPFNFGRKGRNGLRKESSSERLFNEDGEINADNKEDVLEKIQALLEGGRDGTYQTEFQREASVEEDAALVRQAAADPSSAEFKKLGQALLNPIKEVIDYEGVTRKFWAPRKVNSGEVIRYDKDAFVVAHVIGEDGQTPQSVVEGKYVYPPEFEVSAFASIELKDQYRAQYDILARTQDRSRQAIEYQEDVAGVNLLQTGGAIENSVTYFSTFNLAAIESIRYQIERHRLVCDKMLIHRQEVSDLVNTVSGQVDPVTQRELIMAGYIGSILNTMFVTTAGTNTYEILSAGEGVAVTAPDHLGGFAQRVELMSEPVSEFHEGRPRRGWFWWEMICLALVNAKGVALGSKT